MKIGWRFGARVELESSGVRVTLAMRPRAIITEKTRTAASLTTRQFRVTVTDRTATARAKADHAKTMRRGFFSDTAFTTTPSKTR